MAGGTLASLVIRLGLDARGVSTGVATAERSMSGLSRATTGLGGALGTAKGRITSLLGATGLIGLVGGVAGVAHELESSVTGAEEWGYAVQKMGVLSGLGATQMSALSAGMAHFGITTERQTRLVAMATKNIGNLALNGKKAQKFASDYGFSLTDASGRVLDFNAVLLKSIDYFNDKSIPATKKAALMAKLYGRSWQDLLPVLSAGRGSLAQVEAAAQAAGMTLSQDDLTNITALKGATRDWDTALGGLKVQIGLQLLPVVTDLAKAATSFVQEHRGDILTWVKNGITFGKQLAGTLRDVGGQAVDLGRQAMKFWDSLPAGFKDLIIKGIVAQKAVKFMFGIDLAGLVGDAAGGVIKGLAASIFQRGGTPATPLFVSDIAADLGGRGVPGVVPTGGGSSLLGKIGTGLAVGAAGVGVAGFVATAGEYLHDTAAETADTNAKLGQFLATAPDQKQVQAQIDALNKVPDSLGLIDRTLFNANAGGVHDTWQKQLDALNSMNAVMQADPAATAKQFQAATADLEKKGIPITFSALLTEVQNMTDLAAAQKRTSANAARTSADAARAAAQTAIDTTIAAANAATTAAAVRDLWTPLGNIVSAVNAVGSFSGGTGGGGTWTGPPGTGQPAKPGKVGGGRVPAGWTGPVGEHGPELLTEGSRPGWITPNWALPRAGGDTVHFHIGTLIATDAGVDELQRRMEQRLRVRTRGGQRLVGAA